MKKLILPLFLLLSGTLSAQSLSVDTDTARVSGNAGQNDVHATINLTNGTGSEKTIAWERSLADGPREWLLAFCDNVNCKPPEVTSGTFTLAAGATGPMQLFFYPEGIAGSGLGQVIWWDNANPNVKDTVYYKAAVSEATSIRTAASRNIAFTLYPNPARDNLTVDLKLVQGMVTLSVYDLLGNQVSRQLVPAASLVTINTSGLQRGMYFARVEAGSQSAVRSFIKQ